MTHGKDRTMARARRTPPRNRFGRFMRRIKGALSKSKPRRRKKKSSTSSARRSSAHAPAAALVLVPRTTINPGGRYMSTALTANPRRRRRKRSNPASTNPRRRRRKARNPRHAHHRRRRTARNPLGGGFLKSMGAAVLPVGLGAAGGAVAGFLDTQFFDGKPTLSGVTKVGLALVGAAAMRKHPRVAISWASSLASSFGYSVGVKLGGGIVAHSPKGALKGIAEMSQDSPEMAALLEGVEDDVGDADDGVGDLVEDQVGDAVDEYNEALGDIVEAD
jgi:hypothetical protein